MSPNETLNTLEVAKQFNDDWKILGDIRPTLTHNLVSSGFCILTRAQFLISDNESISTEQEAVLREVAELVHSIKVQCDDLLARLKVLNAKKTD